jgi:hypothetical protein
MKLELKNIKHTAWASEETHCYQASLYVDGKPVAIVSNDGRGGADRDYRHPTFKEESEASGVQPYAFGYRAKMAEVHEYFDGLPPSPFSYEGADGVMIHDSLPQTLEFWCCDQVNDWLSARELKSKLKKEFLFQFADKVGVFAHKTRPSRAHKATILNDLPFDEALAIWKAT